ncbi:hypothetical protein X727_07795 [Mesorhizobium sp. L103C119B0]|nr:hypothetical protein X754_13285 [Mesorhizobium sp. LNJC403B00]ESY28060.1 hypothetical protein X749_19260 [Mesorhizobium sp. LNJC391B00]ESZ04726.1 hypothetical protein X736_20510 [Mesorhizobium sp. L2C089B000]ESZ72413.1 hypothetical protein X727_07795 [Mesorhizobium sp. L103C119B0]
MRRGDYPSRLGSSLLTGSAVPPQQDDHSAIFGSAGIQLTPKAIELKLAVDVVTDAA